jgi:transposase
MDMKNIVTDEQWEYIKSFLPKKKKIGRPRVDDRSLLNGIMYVLRTGCRWSDMPEEFGNGKTANRRFREWTDLGLFDKLNENLLNDVGKEVSFESFSLDSSTIPAKKGGDLVGFDGHKKNKRNKTKSCS